MFTRLLKRWEISASTGSHFEVLDGLRGVAILMVVVCHTFYVNPAEGHLFQMIGYLMAAGALGVPIFFVLSGFLISYPFFIRRAENPEFWYQTGYVMRRASKILPAFYFSVLVFAIFYWVQFHDTAYVESALLWATGLANFVHDPVVFNLSYWSLFVEVQFYILIPILFWLARGKSIKATIFFTSAALFFIPLFFRHLTRHQGIYTSEKLGGQLATQIQSNLMLFPCHLDYFAWGLVFAGLYVLLGDLRQKLKALNLLGYIGATMLLMTIALWSLLCDEFRVQTIRTQATIELEHLLPSLSTFLLLFFVFDQNCFGCRVLSAAWLRFVGVVSYEWFLFHWPVVRWFRQHMGHTNGNVLSYCIKTIVPLAVTFVFAVLFYRYISLPILTHVRNRKK